MTNAPDDDFCIRIVFGPSELEICRVDDGSDSIAHCVLALVRDQAEAGSIAKGREFPFEPPQELLKIADPMALVVSLDQLALHYGLRFVEQTRSSSGKVRIVLEKL